jgi:23S rRNA pseudouridine1911/1915/1917 synthase
MMGSIHLVAAAGGVVAVVKPAGLPTQALAGIDSAESQVRQLLVGQRAGGPAVTESAPYLGVPHRLDRAVSGIMLFAATPRAARKLSRQFERREVKKTYRAVVAAPAAAALPEGLGFEATDWRDWIEKVPDEPRARRAESANAPGAREAITRVRLLGMSAVNATHLMLEFEPLTGRMHQLRLQAACRGLPILGDELYGSPAGFDGGTADDPRARSIALHAWRIEYTDPDSGERITREAPLPEWWPPPAMPPES